MDNKLSIYLVGAIRDNHSEDFTWREEVISKLSGLPVIILNPLAGKTFDKETRIWKVHGLETSPRQIYKQDMWCVDHADIVLANMHSLTQGYHSIGSLMELGRASKCGGLVYLILDENFTGHQNAMFKLHPFLEEVAVRVFSTPNAAIEFVAAQVKILSGTDPHFKGVIGDGKSVEKKIAESIKEKEKSEYEDWLGKIQEKHPPTYPWYTNIKRW